MFYTVYKITNILNGKYYIGKHKTKNLDDGYMGSGKVINAAIEKYGVENFTKVILEQFENATAMFTREKEIVTDEFLLREDTYNLRRGGFGGFDHINKTGKNIWHNGENKIYLKTGNYPLSKIKADGNYEAHRQKLSDGALAYYAAGNENGFKNKTHSVESNAARSEKMKNRPKENHSQFGKMWITSGDSNKTILRTDSIPEGWRAGRVMK